jgi:hypothetical protein
MECAGGCKEVGVQGPQAAVAQTRRCEQMGVYPSDSRAEQPMLVQEAENFFVVRPNRGRQPLQIAENLWPGSKIATGNLADHERVHQNVAVDKCLA